MTGKAVVFDMDGTLVVFRFDGPGARKAIVGELASMGFNVTGMDRAGPTQAVVDAARAQVESGAVRMSFDDVRAKVFAILDRFESYDRDTRLAFPGTKATLDYLRSKEVRMGVLTNSGRASTSHALARAGIADMFEFVLTRDEVKSMKPNPEGVMRAVKLFGLPARSIFHVGDSTYDIAAARVVGLKVVSVASGNYSGERLREEGADFVIPTIADLPRVLDV